MENEIIKFVSKYITLTKAEKKALLEADFAKTYKKGTVLLKEGQIAREGYFVLKGCVKAYYIINGEEKITNFYTEGEAIEPVSLVTRQPSEYYLVCMEDCTLNVGDPDADKEAGEKHPRFQEVCRMASEHMLAKKQADFDFFKNSTPEERYLRLLETRPDLVQRVPQYQLASYLGLKPESLSRIRKRLLSA